jgi:monofunctional biosynthetic peptidoglycan transglycosylase
MRRWIVAVSALTLLALVVQLALVVVEAGLPRVDPLARRAPRRTALMRAREAQARKAGRSHHVDQRWVAYGGISPLLRRAVLIAEDDAFFSHGGLDWHEIGASARTNLKRGRVLRGGSTISQQLAKNLYLSEERSLTRKLKEVVLALRLERALTKRRIFELYLNLIEWGDGIYGIEAAARRHFGVSAAALDARQAALLAAVIVNPLRFSPTQPSRRTEKRMRMILRRMMRGGVLTEDQYRAALGESQPASGLEWLFGPPAESPVPIDTTWTEVPSDTAAIELDSLPAPASTP